MCLGLVITETKGKGLGVVRSAQGKRKEGDVVSCGVASKCASLDPYIGQWMAWVRPKRVSQYAWIEGV